MQSLLVSCPIPRPKHVRRPEGQCLLSTTQLACTSRSYHQRGTIVIVRAIGHCVSIDEDVEILSALI